MIPAIRFAAEDDVAFIKRLEDSSLHLPWPEDSIRELVTGGEGKVALICEDRGYVGATYVCDEAEIGNIAVLEEYRGQGVGSALLARLQEELSVRGISRIFLEVEDSNTNAINLYKRFGFAQYNLRKDYYGKGHDAILMSKNISPSR